VGSDAVSAWGKAWGNSWGGAWGAIASAQPPTNVSGGFNGVRSETRVRHQPRRQFIEPEGLLESDDIGLLIAAVIARQ